MPENISSPPESKRPSRLTGGMLCVVVAIAIPLIYFIVSVNGLKNSLRIETTYSAKSIEKIVQSRPELWEFETLRLLEIISQPTSEAGPEQREIRNPRGELIVETSYRASTPSIAATAPIYDSGRLVGTLIAHRTIIPQLINSTFLGGISALLGCLLYVMILRMQALIIRRENDLRKYAAQIETTLGELQTAKEDAETANRAKSLFLANMSHELRTPMTIVLGMAELLLKRPMESAERHYIETMHKSSVALLAIINDLLDLSRIESGRMELNSAPFLIRQTVQDIVELFAEQAERHQIEVVWQCQDDVPEVVIGDQGRIRQVLTNLVNNAVKFTEQGRVVVTVATEREHKDSWVLRIEVADTGIGISPEAIDRIFDRFFQADGSMTRNHGGAGMGLSIAKQLAEIMGGTIQVRSEPGAGSTFSFTVHLKRYAIHPVGENAEHHVRV
jgi:signal transduction histidine kinase